MTAIGLSPHAILSVEEEQAVLTSYARQIEKGRVTLETAAELTGIDALILRKLVRENVITGAAPYRVADVVGWCNIDQARVIASQLQAARRSAGDIGMLATEAAQKYRFSRVSIYKWLASGWIREAGRAQNGDLLLNEGDIAFARALVQLSRHAQGKAVFPVRPKPRSN